MAKRTKKQMYEEIIDILLDYEDTADLVTFCDNEIALLDKKAALASKNQKKKKDEKAETAERLFSMLTIGKFYSKEDAALLLSAETTPCQARYLLQLLVKNGKLEVYHEEADRYKSGKRRFRTLYAVTGSINPELFEKE